MLPVLFALAVAQQPLFFSPVNPPEARYEIDCALDSGGGLAKGSEVVRFTNPGKRALTRLALEWETDPRSRLEVKVNGKPAIPAAGTSGLVLLDLPEPVPAAGEVRLEIAFEQPFVLPDSGPYRVTDRWHPLVHWDYPVHNEFIVRLRAPEPYRVATSARFDAATQAYRGTHLARFGIALTRRLQSIAKDVDGVEVEAWHTPAGEACAKLLLDTAADAVRFYRQRFGFYPHNRLLILPGGSRPQGGYPVTSAIVVVHGQEQLAQKPETHWRWITAHEIGHQYWSEHVLAEGPERLDWLVIGLGIWVDSQYARQRGLAARHRAFLEEYEEAVRKGLDTTADRTPEHYEALDFDYNNKIIHAKGFSIVSALASAIGAEAFDRAHQRALHEYAGRRFSWRALQRLCEEESGEDLGWFFAQWVRSSRYASYEVAGVEGNRVQVRESGGLQMPVTVEGELGDGSRQQRRTERLLASQSVQFSGAVKTARLDPAGQVALVVPPPPMGSAQLNKRLRAIGWSGAGAEAKELFATARRLGIKRQSDWFQIGCLLYDARFDAEALEAFQTAAGLADPPAAAASAWVWQGHELDLLGRREEALAQYRRALESWSAGNTLRHDQWGLVIDRNWIEQRLQKPFVRP